MGYLIDSALSPQIVRVYLLIMQMKLGVCYMQRFKIMGDLALHYQAKESLLKKCPFDMFYDNIKHTWLHIGLREN